MIGDGVRDTSGTIGNDNYVRDVHEWGRQSVDAMTIDEAKQARDAISQSDAEASVEKLEGERIRIRVGSSVALWDGFGHNDTSMARKTSTPGHFPSWRKNADGRVILKTVTHEWALTPSPEDYRLFFDALKDYMTAMMKLTRRLVLRGPSV